MLKLFKKSINNKELIDNKEPFIEKKNPNNIILNSNDIILNPNEITWKDTIPFVFPVTYAYVIKVYDGDTITIASKLPYKDSPLYRVSVRLNGIDTPEMKGSNITDDEKTAANQTKEFVINLILNKYVRLENVQNEKYGRILADVYIKDIHLNQLLIKEKYAVVYNGGTKIKPNSWLNYRLTGKLD
jgi:endonuclease YncB( thermonuclease family)